MANIQIRNIPTSGTPEGSSYIVFDDGEMKKGLVSDLADGVRPVASEAEAEAGSDNAKTMTALRTKQSLASEVGVSVQAHSANLDSFSGKTAPSGTVVGTTDTQTLTNKTLTTPAISSPTGLVKADVGLSNVDNTSDATKNAASASLTNKDLTSGTNTFPTFNQNTTGSAAKLTTARNIDGQAFDGTANITVIAPGTHAATGKTTPVDADELPLVDSAASNVLKKLTWANLKTALGAVFASASQGAKADSAVQSVVAGSNVTVDNTDPRNPVVSATGGGSGSGDVVGPASATDGHLVSFDTSTGKLIKDSGRSISDFATSSRGLPSGGSAGQVLAKIDGTNYNTQWVGQSGGGQIVITPEQYGAVGDGSTDDSTAINSAISAAGIGGIVDFGPKVYACSSTIVQSLDGVTLRGRQSGGTFSSSPTTTEGTVLKWTGSSGGTLAYFGCLSGGSADLCGGGIDGIQFDGNALAAKVLWLRSCSNSAFHHIKARNSLDSSSAYAMFLDSDVQARSGVNSMYRCNFYGTILEASNSGHGLFLTGASDETSGKHPSFCNWYGLHVVHKNGDAIRMTSADSLSLHDFGVSKIAGGTGLSVNLVAGSNKIITGISFFNPGLGSNDTPTFKADQSASGSKVNGVAIYGMPGVDTAPTITLAGGATIERIDYLGHYSGSDLSARGAYSVSPAIRLLNYADADSTALDYYKERLNNVTLSFGGGSTGLTYGANFYRATRIGNVVFYKVQFTLTNKGSSTGAAVISGLPYSCIDSYAAAISASNMTSGVGDTDLSILTSGTAINLYKQSSGAQAQLTNADFTNTTQLIISGVYHTADASA